MRISILVLYLNLVGRLSAFHCWVLCWCEFVIYSLYYVDIYSLYTHFDKSFLPWLDVEFCQMLFSVSIEMIMWFLFFLLLTWYITLIDLHMLTHSLDPGINSTWSWCVLLFIYCWIYFANSLLWIFASIFIKDIGL